MIKKILLLAAAMFLLVGTYAIADDGTRWDDGTVADIKIISAPKTMDIGSEYTYTVEITNHTGLYIWFFRIDTNAGNIYSHTLSECEMYIDPYQKKRIEITSTVSDEIPWFERDGKFYTELTPVMDFETYEDLEKSYIGSYIVEAEKPKYVEITNINDGSEYLSLSFTEENEPFIYQCVERTKKSDTYEYTGQMYIPMTIENRSDTAVKNIFVQAKYNLDNKYFELDAGQSMNIEMYFENTLPYKNTPNTIDIQQQLLFMLDNKYYGVTSEKSYQALYFEMPKINMTIKQYQESDETEISLYNYSNKKIENFFLSFENYDSAIPEHVFPVIEPHETAELNLKSDLGAVYCCYYDMGYLYNDWIILWEFGNIRSGEITEECDDYIIRQTDLYDNLKGYAYSKHSSYVKRIEDEPTLAPTAEPIIVTPSPTAAVTALPTATATAYVSAEPTSTGNESIVVVTDSPYIPAWVWITLIGAIVVIIGLILYITIMNNKER